MKSSPDNDNCAVHYICGMPRSGTTWMDACLSSHAACASLGETLYWGRGYISPKNRETYDAAEIDLVCRKLAAIAAQRPNTHWAKLVIDSATCAKDLMRGVSQPSPNDLYLAFSQMQCEPITLHVSSAQVQC